MATELQSGAKWPGHIDDLARLVYCLAVHCTCGRPTQLSEGMWPCSAHRMLTDQHTLDHLAFARNMRQQYIEAEWLVYWEPDEPTEPRGIGRLDLLRRPAAKVSAHLLGARTLACAIAALLVVVGLSAPMFQTTATATPIAAWQTR